MNLLKSYYPYIMPYIFLDDISLSLAEFTNDYIEGELDKTECAVFEEYLSTDDRLALFVRKSKQGKQALKNTFKVQAAADFEEKLSKRIAEEKKDHSKKDYTSV